MNNNIWHVNYHDNFEHYTKTVLLWPMEANPQWFRVVQQGTYPSILAGFYYTLIHKKYQWVFIGLEKQVTCLSAKIIDYVLKKESDDYIQLKISTILNSTDYDTVDKSGLKIWTTDGHVFVSTELKEKMQAMSDNDLYFNIGFSNFAT